ncbi:AAA family ATPase [Priestia koreensis]|uniref:AAA family ATPase n=1 Tax=Priestia koreensis TaxID=284581 RepID=UPI003458D72E
MIIGFLTANSALQPEIETLGMVEDTQIVASVEELTPKQKLFGLIIDEDQTSTAELITLRQRFPKLRVLVLAESDESLLRLKKFATAQQMDVISQRVSNEEILFTLKSLWFSVNHSEYKNVISISGTHPQVGVTQTALSLGKELRALNNSVCVLGFNFYHAGEMPKQSTDYSFDVIYPSLENRLIEKEKIKEVMYEVDKLYYMIGNRNYHRKHAYEMEPIKLLIDYAKDQFDYVLIDIGAQYDTAGALAGLEYSDTHVLVGTQQMVSSQHFNRWKELILRDLGYKDEDFLLVVNKYDASRTLSSKQLAEDLGVPLYNQIPLVADAMDSEMLYGFIHDSLDKPYLKVMTDIARGLTDETYQGDKPTTKKKRSFLLF